MRKKIRFTQEKAGVRNICVISEVLTLYPNCIAFYKGEDGGS